MSPLEWCDILNKKVRGEAKVIKVKWTEEEAIALFDLYFREGMNAPIEHIIHLSHIYQNRATKLGLNIDDKFRNISGLKMQLACIHYVVTDGCEGMSNASKLFYRIYDMYRQNRDRYDMILGQFYEKYGG